MHLPQYLRELFAAAAKARKAEPFKHTKPRLGPLRNKPCPCGSGIKAKKCTHAGQYTRRAIKFVKDAVFGQ